MVVLGNVAHPEVANREYRVKTLDNIDMPLSVNTDGEGRVWLIVGTDSGFEGLTKLYYARIHYTLSLAEPPATQTQTPQTPSAQPPTPQPTDTQLPTALPPTAQPPTVEDSGLPAWIIPLAIGIFVALGGLGLVVLRLLRQR